jgi:integrase/recombinase XerD
MKYLNAEYFRDWLRQKKLKENTISNYICCYFEMGDFVFNQQSVGKFLDGHNNPTGRAFLKNVQDCLLLNADFLELPSEVFNEISKVRIPKVSGRRIEKIIRPLTEQQIRMIEASLETEQSKLMLLLSYHCGLRLQEMIGIKLNSFNWDVWKTETDKMGEVIVFGKGNKEGIAIVPSWLMKRIGSYINNNLKLFGSLNSSLFSVGSRTWHNYLAEAGVKSGVTQLDENGKVIETTQVNPHKLRHSFATNLLKKGADLTIVQEALRHKNISSTQVYLHIDKEFLKNRLEEFK